MLIDILKTGSSILFSFAEVLVSLLYVSASKTFHSLLSVLYSTLPPILPMSSCHLVQMTLLLF